MKKTLFFRTIATAAVFAVVGMSAFAQLPITTPAPWAVNMIAPTLTNATDTVTVGSVMPYQVSGDLAMHALRAQGALTFSDFTKVVTSGGTIGKPDGNAGAPATTDTLFTVKWNTIGAAESVSVTEVPKAAAGQPAFVCTANTQILPVVVVARPTIVWAGNATNSQGGCGIDNTTVNIPITVTGTGQWHVYYKIDYTSLAGVASTPVDNTTTPIAIGSWKPGPQNINLTYPIPTGKTGTYTVTITKISDRISEKSGIASIAGDFPAATYKVFAYPTPQTQPINHIKNL